jgi:glucose-6-phosphate dehydrogenase assembly protein OpcA
MHEEVWAAQNTTPNAVEEALRELLAARARTTEWSSVPARVLNLVVVVDRQFRGEIENRLARVGRYHPSRLVICAVEKGRRQLDAVAALAAEDGRPEPGHIAVTRERVELDIGPKHLSSLATIVDPVLVSDLATVVWSPHGHREAIDSLRHLAQIALIDSLDEPDLGVALARAAELTGDLYVVDLAWLRSTPWRERVAAAFDPPGMRRTLQ